VETLCSVVGEAAHIEASDVWHSRPSAGKRSKREMMIEIVPTISKKYGINVERQDASLLR
jgi:predicted nucleic-acid-binding protein